MRPHLLLQQGCQLRLHEGVVVWDVEADDAGALQMSLEAALQPRPMRLLHDEDYVGPFDQLGRAGLLRIRRKPGGGGLHAGTGGEDLLRRGRAQAVAGAEEEEVGQLLVALPPQYVLSLKPMNILGSCGVGPDKIIVRICSIGSPVATLSPFWIMSGEKELGTQRS